MNTLDFYCKKLRLVIEIDGISHERKRKYDRYRQRRLEKLGLTVIRFYDDQVMQNLGGVVEKLKKVIKQLEKKQGIPPSKGGQGDFRKEK